MEHVKTVHMENVELDKEFVNHVQNIHDTIQQFMIANQMNAMATKYF